MRTLTHLLRAALIGALALYAVGGLMLAADAQQRAEAAATKTSSGAGDAPAEEAPAHGLGDLVVFALGGALAGASCALLLLLFPVGPVAKVVYGLFLGPIVPMTIWLPGALERGPGDAGGIVLLGALVGLLVGMLDASRTRGLRAD